MSTAIPFEPPNYHSVHTSSPSTNTIQNDDFGTALDDHLPEYGALVASGAVQSSTTRLQSAPERVLPKEFSYKTESKGKPIVVLNVLAPVAISKNIPTFSGQGPIKGNVRLSFEKPETIQSVVVSVCCLHSYLDDGYILTSRSPFLFTYRSLGTSLRVLKTRKQHFLRYYILSGHREKTLEEL